MVVLDVHNGGDEKGGDRRQDAYRPAENVPEASRSEMGPAMSRLSGIMAVAPAPSREKTRPCIFYLNGHTSAGS